VIRTRGSFQNGCPFAPFGLKYRRPSKWSLGGGMQEDNRYPELATDFPRLKGR
jgi:hypothetical protein